MHIFFSGIGGTGIGPLALIAKQAGYEVSGSDSANSDYIKYLTSQGITDIHIGQSAEKLAEVNAKHPIDWFVYSSALPKTDPNHPELGYVKENGIKATKRDVLLNKIINDHKLKLIAIAGTHGKTTTTAMVIWLFKQLDVPVSYSLGAKINFGDMGHFDPKSEYFVLEADEFDHNFLAFEPELTIIPGITYDHQEIYPTQQDYYDAFKQFINKSKYTYIWYQDNDKLDNWEINKDGGYVFAEQEDWPEIDGITLSGLYNRRDAWLVIRALDLELNVPSDPAKAKWFYQNTMKLINKFPGVSRRFEKLAENLYSDYAHTPEKIIGAMSVAEESTQPNQKIVVVYEPLTNRRMHYTASEHKDVFDGASKIYWVPSYLARENPAQKILSPEELIEHLSQKLQEVAEPAKLDQKLKNKLVKHLENGDLVLALSGGGAGSLDEWLRQEFAN